MKRRYSLVKYLLVILNLRLGCNLPPRDILTHSSFIADEGAKKASVFPLEKTLQLVKYFQVILNLRLGCNLPWTDTLAQSPFIVEEGAE